ncbi:MAG: PIG-L deacetylase family protein [Desulfurivibrionaceae bacterium]
MNILVVAAHPDDEVLGCGGTIARMVREGHQVMVAILGEGITSRGGNREEADQNQLHHLRQCSLAAAERLGGVEVLHYDFPDNRFDTVPLLELVKHIEALIMRCKPEIIYTQHGGDLNIDHAVTFRATLTAARPQKHSKLRALYAYEVPSSTEWSFQRFAPVFRPTVFRDITETLELKMAAMQCYEGESRLFPHPRSLENLRATAQRWGSVAGLDAAEAFELIMEVA